MVENVEQLGSKLELVTFLDVKVLVERHIKIDYTGSNDRTQGSIPKIPGRDSKRPPY